MVGFLVGKYSGKIKLKPHIFIMHNESKIQDQILPRRKQKNIDLIYKSVVDGKITFGDAAVKHSDCSSAEHGGDLVNLEEE